MPKVGDMRIKVQRSDRFRWHAVAQEYAKDYGRTNRLDWLEIGGWRSAPFRWAAVARARRDVNRELRPRRRDERRRRYQATEYLDV